MAGARREKVSQNVTMAALQSLKQRFCTVETAFLCQPKLRELNSIPLAEQSPLHAAPAPRARPRRRYRRDRSL